MRQMKLLLLFIVFSFVVTVLYSQDGPSLGEIARQNRAQRAQQKDNGVKASAPVSRATATTGSAPGTASSSPASSDPAGSPASSGSTAGTGIGAEAKAKLDAGSKQLGVDKQLGLEDYSDLIRGYLNQEEFEKLDQVTDAARSTRARLPGGFWSLHIAYMQLMQPVQGISSSEAEWTIHLNRLKRWVSLRPKSTTARVALAAAYLQYGWTARGGGYADKVTDGGWKLFGERADLAYQTLVDAFSLPTKDPEWYLTMQLVARAQSQSKDMQGAIFEKAAAFEPDYQYYYRTRAESLLPKWDGEEGEMASFAGRAADRIGGKKGDMVYYQIATFLNCHCSNDSQLNGMSWERIKSGYAAVEEQYGESLENVNQMCYMAAISGDPVYADEFFGRIGENWDKKTWRSRENFEGVRGWAKTSVLIKVLVPALSAADENVRTPEGRTFDEQIAQTFTTNYSDALTACLKSTGEASLTPFELVLQLGKDGKVEKALVTSPSDTSLCLEAKVQKGVFPVPPRPSYWVKITFQQR
jgi:hypothetical protein